MKSGGIRRLGLKPLRSLTRAEFEAIERNVFNAERSCDRCSGGTWTDSNGIRRRCAYCRGTGKVREAAYVDGSQDDLTRDLDVITDIAALGDDPPSAA